MTALQRQVVSELCEFVRGLPAICHLSQLGIAESLCDTTSISSGIADPEVLGRLHSGACSRREAFRQQCRQLICHTDPTSPYLFHALKLDVPRMLEGRFSPCALHRT